MGELNQTRHKVLEIFLVQSMNCGLSCTHPSLTSEAGPVSQPWSQGCPHVLHSVCCPTFSSPGALLDPTFLFQCITSNIICSIVFGERFDYKDRQFLRLLDLFYQTFSLISSLSSQVRGRKERSTLGKEKRKAALRLRKQCLRVG